MDESTITTLSTDGGSSIPTIFEPEAAPIETPDTSVSAGQKDTDTLQPSGGDDNTQDTKGSEDGKKTPYHEDPAWQRIIAERNEARENLIRLEERNRMLEERASRVDTKAPAENEDALSEIMGMDNEALTTLIVDNPKEFTKLIAEKVKEHAVREAVRLSQEENTKTSALSEFRKVVDTYEKENPDFRRMWDSGDIKRFMDSHPYHGYNAITAHKAMTENARIETAKAAAEAKALERAKKTQEGKEGLRTVLGSGPAANAGNKSTIPKELANTKAYGGFAAVMSRQLEAMRSGKT